MSASKIQLHEWSTVKRLPWPVCKGCGLLALRNALTDWCIKRGCNYDEHPGYKGAVATLGRPS